MSGQHRKGDIIKEVENLENVIFVCFGQPDDIDLPQIAGEDDVIVDLMQHVTGRPHGSVEAEFNHQIDGSYQ